MRSLALCLLCAFASTLRAEPLVTDTISARSVSGQFIVYSPRQKSSPPGFGKDADLLHLEPSLVTVSCERIKQALTSEIGAGGQWRGRIHCTLHPAQSAADPITLVSERFKDNWAYRLDIPNPVERTRFVRGVVQALLLEEANRQAGERSAEIPLWLAEGLARQVLAVHGFEVILAPPRLAVNGLTVSPAVVDVRRSDSLALARRDLAGQLPLTLEELSWPKDGQLDGAEAGIYRASAQLFVSDLLQFPDGRGCLHAMLEALPQFHNWQLAFLRAFQPHFQRQLDVEKWWALQVEFFLGRDGRGLWSPEDSWAKLDEILRAAVQVRREKKELPSSAKVPLATVIRTWDFARQVPVLRAKLAELDGARLRVARDLVPVVDAYRQTLADYLKKRDQVGEVLSGSKATESSASVLVSETLRKLDALEAQRQGLKPQPAAPMVSRGAATAIEGVK